MKTRMIILSAIAVLLTGCATTNSYQEPNTSTKSATVSGSSVRNGMFDWSDTSIDSIDNKSVNSFWSNTAKVRVQPGMHQFVIATNYNKQFLGNGPFVAMTEVRVNVQPYKNYHFASKVNGTTVSVWAADDLGRQVSSAGSSHSAVAPRSYVVPIIISN